MYSTKCSQSWISGRTIATWVGKICKGVNITHPCSPSDSFILPILFLLHVLSTSIYGVVFPSMHPCTMYTCRKVQKQVGWSRITQHYMELITAPVYISKEISNHFQQSLHLTVYYTSLWMKLVKNMMLPGTVFRISFKS